MATGEQTRVRLPRGPARHLRDERQRVTITGVNNRDARLVYDARVAELKRSAGTVEDDGDLARQLLEVYQLGLWRARALTGFDAFAVDVVGLERDAARALAEREAEAQGTPLSRLPEGQVALWLRTEAAVREHTPTGRVRLCADPAGPQLELRVPAEPTHAAVSALAGVGRQAAGLGRHLAPSAEARDRQAGSGPGGPPRVAPRGEPGQGPPDGFRSPRRQPDHRGKHSSRDGAPQRSGPPPRPFRKRER